MRDYDRKSKLEEKALKELLDISGRKLKVGQTVAYAVSLGRSAGVQLAKVHSITDKNKVRLEIIEKYRKTWGEKPIVTMNYCDRIAILEPLETDQNTS